MSDEVYLGGVGFVDVEGGKSIGNLQAKRTIKSQAVTINATATPIPSTPLQYRRGMLIMNSGTNIVYLGGSDVTTANGFNFYPRAVVKLDIAESVSIYGISAAGGDTVKILEGA